MKVCTHDSALSLCFQVYEVVWNEVFQGGPPDLHSCDVSVSHNSQLGAVAGQQVRSSTHYSSEVSKHMCNGTVSPCAFFIFWSLTELFLHHIWIKLRLCAVFSWQEEGADLSTGT